MNNFKLDTLNLAGIDNMEDVLAFLDFVIKDQKLFYHPMDNFVKYKKYNEEQIELMSCLAEGCHRECEYLGTDFFAVTGEYYQRLIDKLCPSDNEEKAQPKTTYPKPQILIVIEGGNIQSAIVVGGSAALEVFDYDLAKAGDATDTDKTVHCYPAYRVTDEEYEKAVEELDSIYADEQQ